MSVPLFYQNSSNPHPRIAFFSPLATLNCKDLIGEIEKRLFEHQGHQSGTSPIYSLSDLEKGYFRTAGEVFSVSLAQGGPAPCFLRQWCFDYLSAGDLDEANLTKDDVDDAEL